MSYAERTDNQEAHGVHRIVQVKPDEYNDIEVSCAYTSSGNDTLRARRYQQVTQI